MSTVCRFVVIAALAVMALVASLPGSFAVARTASISPSDRDLLYRRYRGDDEVSEHDRGRGRGRGQGSGHGQSGDDHQSSGGGSGNSQGGSQGQNSGSSGGHSGPDNDDSDDRFGK